MIDYHQAYEKTKPREYVEKKGFNDKITEIEKEHNYFALAIAEIFETMQAENLKLSKALAEISELIKSTGGEEN